MLKAKSGPADTGNKLPFMPFAEYQQVYNEETPVSIGSNHQKRVSHVASKQSFPHSNLTSHRLSQESSPAMN